MFTHGPQVITLGKEEFEKMSLNWVRSRITRMVTRNVEIFELIDDIYEIKSCWRFNTVFIIEIWFLDRTRLRFFEQYSKN